MNKRVKKVSNIPPELLEVSKRFIELIYIIGFRNLSDFASQVGVKPITLYHIESGRMKLPLSLVRTTFDKFQKKGELFNIHWLFFGEGSPLLDLDEVFKELPTYRKWEKETSELRKLLAKVGRDNEKAVKFWEKESKELEKGEKRMDAQDALIKKLEDEMKKTQSE